MAGEIVNRVANSKLKTIDLEDFYPQGQRMTIDLKQWLYEGLILREKDFREALKNHDWQQYQDAYVAIFCSSEAIVPSWSYILITTYLSKYAKKVVVGDLELLETTIFQEIIQNLDTTVYLDKPVIIKGCANKPIPKTAYTQLVAKLVPTAKSIMFGEACSTVPLFKK